MRLLARILVLAAVVAAPAVVAPIGCAVDSDRYPGVSTGLPNSPAGGGPTETSSASASSSSSTTGGPPVDACTCAATFVLAGPDGGACGKCGYDSSLAGGMCASLQTACNADGACQIVLQSCVKGCGSAADVGACIAGCIKSSPAYEALITCQCGQCQGACQGQPALTCDLSMGTGGSGGGGTGGSGTGGAAPDAGDGG